MWSCLSTQVGSGTGPTVCDLLLAGDGIAAAVASFCGVSHFPPGGVVYACAKARLGGSASTAEVPVTFPDTPPQPLMEDLLVSRAIATAVPACVAPSGVLATGTGGECIVCVGSCLGLVGK